MSKLPVDYRVQPGRHNCGYVFVWTEYDCGAYFYCTFGAPKRPPCGSVALGEVVPHYDAGAEDGMHADWKIWEEWSRDREVAAAGHCESWEASTAT